MICPIYPSCVRVGKRSRVYSKVQIYTVGITTGTEINKCGSRGVIPEDKEGIRRSGQEGKTIQEVKTEGKATQEVKIRGKTTQRVKIRGKTTQPALLICQVKPYYYVKWQGQLLSVAMACHLSPYGRPPLICPSRGPLLSTFPPPAEVPCI